MHWTSEGCCLEGGGLGHGGHSRKQQARPYLRADDERTNERTFYSAVQSI